jgi:hypothetical protein
VSTPIAAGPRLTRHRIPRWVWVVAVLVGAMHMIPYAVATWRTPEGWTFTGNLTVSPDYMQYRTWARQTQAEGPIVSNRFTAEPNGKFLPVPFYWGIGMLSRLTAVTPEWIYAWLGVPLAMAMVLLLHASATRFSRVPAAVPWVVGTMILGGGLGAILSMIADSPSLSAWPPLRTLVVEPMEGAARVVPFESYRGNYVFQALFDTHFLAFWVAATAAVLALHAVVREYSHRRLVAMIALFAAATILHVYEGVTLMAITIGVIGFCVRRGMTRRHALTVFAAASVTVGICLVGALALQRAAGFPTPDWRGLMVPPSILVLAYPVAWLLIVTGGVRFWQEADRSDAFLVGWAAGCLSLVLAGPFFPYPDRGTMTLQIPLYLIAATIYFRQRQHVRATHVALLLVLCGPTLLLTSMRWKRAWFHPTYAHKWVRPAHTRVIHALATRSTPADLLLATEETLRWLGPEYPGRHFAGHFFLTIGYTEKQQALLAFLDSRDLDAQQRFLRESGATLLFVETRRNPDHFRQLPMLTPLIEEDVGVLFAVAPPGMEGK